MDKRKINIWRIISGCIFLGVAIYIHFAVVDRVQGTMQAIMQILEIVLFGCALSFCLPIGKGAMAEERERRRLTPKTIVAVLFVLLLIPITVICGIFLMNNGYYLVSLMVIVEAIVAFILAFEGRKPQAKELIVISILCAISVGSRIILAGLPTMKPIVAIVIISGVAFGAETGFLVGSMSAFVSNFYFGQSVFTPCQMLAWGLIGFVAGLIFMGSRHRGNSIILAVYGFLAVLVFHGGITNVVSSFMFYPSPSWELIKSSIMLGLPYDLIFAMSTAFFLCFLVKPMGEMLDRIKIKYGI